MYSMFSFCTFSVLQSQVRKHLIIYLNRKNVIPTAELKTCMIQNQKFNLLKLQKWFLQSVFLNLCYSPLTVYWAPWSNNLLTACQTSHLKLGLGIKPHYFINYLKPSNRAGHDNHITLDHVSTVRDISIQFVPRQLQISE